jgi:SAM-dependent methyltransferase
VPPDELLLRALRASARDPFAGQRRQWTEAFAARPDRYGAEPSEPARAAARLFSDAGLCDVLELGAGQGRDALFLAREGFHVHALDYAPSGVVAIREKAAQAAGQATPGTGPAAGNATYGTGHASHGTGAAAGGPVPMRLAASVHDCREPLPFAAQSFDACYSHMLYCMALTTPELKRLSAEVLRVLRPGGLQVYTVRTIDDPDFGTGRPLGDDVYETGGFAVHFFGRELVARLARGFELLEVAQFEEGALPRRLFRVTQRKPM